MKNLLIKIVTISILINLVFVDSSMSENIIMISPSRDFVSLLKNLKPGDIALFEKGTYDFGKPIELNIKGDSIHPIRIKSKEISEAKIIGNSGFILKLSSHVIIEGFTFVTTNGPAIKTENCNNIRITRNIFRLKEDKPSSWVIITGNDEYPDIVSSNNRIDHNLFENKKLLGNFITIEGTTKPIPKVSQFDIIDYNHFKNIGPRVENVLEAIRVGSSEYTFSRGNTLIEKNLFERCDGDPEIVSIKSSNNIIRYNTFRECLGVLSLRHGNSNLVEGNFFIGNNRIGSFLDSTGKKWQIGTGGVRFCGDSMIIVNNYFEGLTGTGWDAPMAIINGNADYDMNLPLTKHYRIRFAVVAYNTFVNNIHGIEIGYTGENFQGNYWDLPPKDVVIANNIIYGSKKTAIRVFTNPINAIWRNNIYYPPDPMKVIGYDYKDFIIENPHLKKFKFFQLDKNSSAVNRADKDVFIIKYDIEGQQRDLNPDIGADEYSQEKKKNFPLTSKDVGPFKK